MSGENTGVALVTGAASGIGAVVGRRLADHGWKVAGIDLNPSAADLSLQVDVTDLAAMRAAAERVAAELGPVTALVTAAGVYEMVPVADIDDERWRRMLALHLGGVANACWAVLPSMLAAGFRDGGHDLVRAGARGRRRGRALRGGQGRDPRPHAVARLGARPARHSGEQRRARARPTRRCSRPTPPGAIPPTWRRCRSGGSSRPDEVAETVLFLIEEGTYFAGPDALPERRSRDLMQRTRRPGRPGQRRRPGARARDRHAARGRGGARGRQRPPAVGRARPGGCRDSAASRPSPTCPTPTRSTRMVGEVEEALGPIEVLAANHAYMTMKPFVEHDPGDWWHNVDVNLSGTFFLVRSVLPGMRKLRRRAHRDHRLGVRRGRLGERDRLLGLQGRADLADEDARARARPREHPRQRDRPRDHGHASARRRRRGRGRLARGDPAPLRRRHPDRPHRPPGGDGRAGHVPQQRRAPAHSWGRSCSRTAARPAGPPSRRHSSG